MGIVQKDAFRTTIISYIGIALGYLNKGLLFVKILSKEQIGLVALLIAVGTLFAQFSTFGTAFTTLKFLPFFKDYERKHHGFLAFMLGIITSGAIIVTAAYILLKDSIQERYSVNASEFVDYYYWVIPIGIGYAVYLFLEAYLRSFYKNIVSVFAYEIVLRLGVTISLLLYYFECINFHSFIIINCVIYLFPPLILIISLWRDGELHLAPSGVQISRKFKSLMVRFSAYNYINTLGIVLVVSLDVMMISDMIGLGATGIYSTIVFIASVLLVPNRALIRVSGPIVAEYWKSRDMLSMNSLYKKSSSVSLFISLAGFILIWFNIDLFLSFLHPDFLIGKWVFFTLMMGRFFEIFFGLTGVIFSTSKKFKYDVYFTLALVVIVYALNLLFIPKYGIVGASVSTAIAIMVYNVGRYIFVLKTYRLNPFEKNQFIVILIGVATLVLGELVGELIQNMWVRSAVVTMLFVILFIVPNFLFKLEPQSIAYFYNGIGFIKSKLMKK